MEASRSTSGSRRSFDRASAREHRGDCGVKQIHLGIEKEFRPAKKAHPALIVDDLDELARELRKASYDVTIGEDLPGIRRLFVADPFGNRIAFLQRS